MKRTFSSDSLHDIEARLDQAQKAFHQRYPGESGERQPVHVVYGGAQLFKSGNARRLGDLALRSMDEYAPDFVAFAKAFQLPGAEKLPDEKDAERFARTIYERVREKLLREPVEELANPISSKMATEFVRMRKRTDTPRLPRTSSRKE